MSQITVSEKEVVTSHIISSFPARVYSVSLPPRSAARWCTRGTCGHAEVACATYPFQTQTRAAMPCHHAMPSYHDGASLITEQNSSGELPTGTTNLVPASLAKQPSRDGPDEHSRQPQLHVMYSLRASQSHHPLGSLVHRYEITHLHLISLPPHP